MPMGRPSKIDQVVRHRGDGSAVTAGQQVIERIQLGQDLTDAADSAGISRATLHKWRLAGARARAEAIEGVRLRAADKRLADFVDALERAEGEAEANRLAIIQRVAQGGATITKITEKRQVVYNDAGVASERVVERTIVTETLRPEWTAAAWWLERRRKGYTKRVELTGAEGTPLVPPDVAARNIADDLRVFLAGAQAATEEVAPQPSPPSTAVTYARRR